MTPERQKDGMDEARACICSVLDAGGCSFLLKLIRKSLDAEKSALVM